MKRKILVIEDEHDILAILTRWLTATGMYAVETANTGREALELLGRGWDLVVSDVYLPDMDGIQIAARIKQSRMKSPVLLMTGHLTTEVTLQALNHHVDGFLTKPLNRGEFLSKVNLLSASSARNDVESNKERVLAIGAHPDDVEIGCGGILLNHRNAGDDICILTLSRGECGGQTGVRSEEAMLASSFLGAELILGEFDDTKITEGAESIETISAAINKFAPTVVYTHSLHDAHQDHRNTHRASVVAARGVRKLECYQSPSSTIQFNPSRFVDITQALPEKQKLLSCYQSQREKCVYLRSSLIEATAEYWGRYAGFVKVEPLEVIRST